MSDIKHLQQLIEDELKQVLFPSHPAALYEPVKYMLSIGGKRIRPLLVLMGCELFNGDIRNALSPALGIEIFHNFTLLHDDIMDKAPVRRGMSTVHEKWNSNIAILSGDAMFVKAFQLLLKTDPENIAAITSVFTTTALEVCEGQQLDMDFERRNDVTLEDYLEMIRLKTAVLLGCSLKTGAIIAGASPEESENIYKAGCNLGLAFQLQDDLLDLYGEEKQFGKVAGGDVVANKKTYLVLKALNLADVDQKKEIQQLLNSEMKHDQKVKLAKVLFNELNITAATHEAMDHYYNKAMKMIDGLQVDHANKQPLIKLADSLRVRAV